MQPESLYDEIITRFLLKEASPEEETLVLEWMETDQKNRLYVEELQKTLQLLSIRESTSKINLDKEWERLRSEIANTPIMAPVPEGEACSSEWEIDKEERKIRRTKTFRLVIGSAAAASIILTIGFNSGWFSDKNVQVVGKGEQIQSSEQSNKFDPLIAVVQHEVNTSGKTKWLTLPDGSEIALFDSSELTYKEPATGGRRDVYLIGKADFKVAKNKAKPFTVFSEDISTTAVGTQFTVTAKVKENLIRVKLFEGKVVVKSLKGYYTKWTNDIQLIPNQELICDKSTKTVSVVWFATGTESNKVGISQTKENPSVPHYDKRSWFMFNNQPLNEIFDALSEMYDTKIVYIKKDVNDMYFIGTYDKSDSLEKILKQIAWLNNLKLTKQNDTFRLERKIVKN